VIANDTPQTPSIRTHTSDKRTASPWSDVFRSLESVRTPSRGASVVAAAAGGTGESFASGVHRTGAASSAGSVSGNVSGSGSHGGEPVRNLHHDLNQSLADPGARSFAGSTIEIDASQWLGPAAVGHSDNKRTCVDQYLELLERRGPIIVLQIQSVADLQKLFEVQAATRLVGHTIHTKLYLAEALAATHSAVTSLLQFQMLHGIVEPAECHKPGTQLLSDQPRVRMMVERMCERRTIRGMDNAQHENDLSSSAVVPWLIGLSPCSGRSFLLPRGGGQTLGSVEMESRICDRAVHIFVLQGHR
jgi:hypothetical protein